MHNLDASHRDAHKNKGFLCMLAAERSEAAENRTTCLCRSISTMPRFQSPPPRTQRADFPHCALRLASREGVRRADGWQDLPIELDDAAFTEHVLRREVPGPARTDLMSASEEVADTVGDVPVDLCVGARDGAVAEVRAPALQQRVELI